MARRKTWPEGVVGRRGRKAWSEDVLARIAGLFQMAEFFLGSPRLAMLPNRASKDDTDGETPSREGCPLWRATALQAQRELRFITAVSNKMSVIEDSALGLWRELSCDWSDPSILAHCSQKFRVPGRRLYSQCSVVSLWSLSFSLSVHGQRESGSSTRSTQLPSAGNHWLLRFRQLWTMWGCDGCVNTRLMTVLNHAGAVGH